MTLEAPFSSGDRVVLRAPWTGALRYGVVQKFAVRGEHWMALVLWDDTKKSTLAMVQYLEKA